MQRFACQRSAQYFRRLFTTSRSNKFSKLPLRTNHTMVPAVNQHILPNQTAHTYHNFDLIKKIKLDYTDVVVSKWKSRVTGLSVVHIDYEGEQA
jgi:hypothetical protein